MSADVALHEPDLDPASVDTRRAVHPARRVPYELLLAVGQVGLLTVLLHRSYFYVDDFLRLGEAHRGNLDWTYLSSPIFNHFAPGFRIVMYGMARWWPLQFWPAALWITACQVVVTVCLYRLLVEITGSRTGRSLWLTVLLGTSPIFLSTWFWWANALHVLSSLAGTLASAYFFVRWWRRGSAWRLVAAWAAFAFGLGFYEKPLLLVALLPALVLALALRTERPAQAVRSVLRLWPAWLGYLLIAGSYAAYVAHRQYAGDERTVSPELVKFVGYAWFRAVVPGVMGGPFRWTWVWPGGLAFASPPWPLVVGAAAVFVIAVVLWLWGYGRTALLGLGFAVAGWSASAALIGVGRLMNGWIIARDYRYYSDALWIVAIGIAIAAKPVHARKTLVNRRFARSSLAVAAAAYAVAAGVSTVPYYRQWTRTVPRAYTRHLLHDAPIAVRQGKTIFDTAVPTTVALEAGTGLSRLLDLARIEPDYNDLTRPAVAPGPEGHLRDAAFAGTSSVNAPGCSTGPVRIAVPQPVGPQDNMMAVALDAPSGASVLVQVAPAAGPAVDVRTARGWPLQLPPGRTSILAPRPYVGSGLGTPLAPVAALQITGDGHPVCNVHVEFGQVVLK